MDGVAFVNFHEHVQLEMQQVGIDQYCIMGGEMDKLDWRTYLPNQLFNKVKQIVNNRWEIKNPRSKNWDLIYKCMFPFYLFTTKFEDIALFPTKKCTMYEPFLISSGSVIVWGIATNY